VPVEIGADPPFACDYDDDHRIDGKAEDFDIMRGLQARHVCRSRNRNFGCSIWLRKIGDIETLNELHETVAQCRKLRVRRIVLLLHGNRF
jgi:hypothetical protein